MGPDGTKSEPVVFRVNCIVSFRAHRSCGVEEIGLHGRLFNAGEFHPNKPDPLLTGDGLAGEPVYACEDFRVSAYGFFHGH